MKDGLSEFTPDAVGRIGEDGRIYGDGLPALSPADIKVLRASKATAHKLGGFVVCVAPTVGGDIILHCYEKLPKGVRLSDAIALVVEEARRDAPITPAETSRPRPDRIAEKLADALTLKPKFRTEQFLHGLHDAGIESVVAMAPITNGALGKLAFQKSDHAKTRDALTTVLSSSLRSEEAELDKGLIAKQLGGKALSFLLPDNTDKGVAFVFLDSNPTDVEEVKSKLPYLAALNNDVPKSQAATKKAWRYGAWAALVVAILYLLWPAPIYVNNLATVRPSQTQVIALPFGAFLEDVNFRAGQDVTAGETIVTLRAPQIEDALAEQVIQQQLEDITAQEALEGGNIAEFQLAEKRKEIAATRASQLEMRTALLNIIAQDNTKVVSIQSQSDKGVFLAEGSPIVTLQKGQNFDLIVEVAPEDIARLKAGQKGRVSFRGLTTQKHNFLLLSQPVQSFDANTNQSIIQISARIQSDDQSDLIAGLDGFAKVETGRAPRVVGLTRQIREYIRVTLWTYLGITF